SDFWRRWHISLSRWLKDYLYIPLGGNRKGTFRTGFNLFITMLLGGLWHGAAFRFILWGALHGSALILEKIFNSFFAGKKEKNLAARLFSVFLTFNFITFCWIFFRASDMDTSMLMIKMISENFSPGSYGAVLAAYRGVFLLIASGYLIHFLPERVKEAYRGLFIKIPLAAQFTVIIGAAILLFAMRTAGVLPFIYFRF
ncbi:MAG: MBOAT family protein, partial [Bacteroidales bacterium]|nr:MBOAT family protein [Bacteroidales bacterium]